MSKTHKVTVPGHKYPVTVSHGRYAIVTDSSVAQQAKTVESARSALARYPRGYRIYDLMEGTYV